MNIQLKNIKHNKAMSDETECFSADVYVDGVKLGSVMNRGCGGCNDYSNRELHDKLTEHAKTLPPIKSEWRPGEEYPQEADSVIDDLLADHLQRADMRRALGRRVIYTKNGAAGIFETKSVDKVTLKSWLIRPDLMAKLNATTILNLMVEDEAFALYKVEGERQRQESIAKQKASASVKS